MISTSIWLLLLSCISALFITPLVITFARRINLLDQPDPNRKLHKTSIPLGGGIVVALGAIIGCLGVAAVSPELRQVFAVSAPTILPLLIASIIICTVGIVDDIFNLRGRQKFAGQIVAVSVLIASGLIIRKFTVFGWQIELGVMAIPFTAFWLLGAINALNLLDGADGFATTVGTIICATIALLAVMTRHPDSAALACAFTGAMIGFLVYNFPPAKIFLGDAGSMLIGLVVGVLAIQSSLKGPATVALAAPLAVMAIPIFDSGVAVVRRWLTGRALVSADRAHLHHSLSQVGFGPKGMLLVVALCCGATALGAVVSVYIKNEFAALVSVFGVISTLVISRIFGFKEFMLVANRTRALGGSLMLPGRKKRSKPHGEVVRLQGSKEWEIIWRSLVEFAEKHDLLKIRLGLSLPWLHEDFHARWHRRDVIDSDKVWQTSLPLAVNGRILGRLDVSGCLTARSVYHELNLLSDLLEGLEPAILKMADEPRELLVRTA
jgi:UDP-GlcNAc:undecaprenyl-phosphate GlcNAc-1-phosphate transferase